MMITQLFYWRLWDPVSGRYRAAWQTTASDKLYRTRSRAHLITALKPTEKQIRALKKQSRIKRIK